MKTKWTSVIVMVSLTACYAQRRYVRDEYEDEIYGEAPYDERPYGPEFDDNSPSNDYSEPGQQTENCICVPRYQCEDDNIMTGGPNMINPRRSGPRTQHLHRTYISPNSECAPYHVCCSNTQPFTARPERHRCGSRNSRGINGRILSATEKGHAKFGEWPWQGIILKKIGRDFMVHCGATLIDEQHVLTVTHCVLPFLTDVPSMVVRLGEWDTQSTNELLPHEDFEVEEIFLHPRYSSKIFSNNIAVLRLKRTVVFKPHIDAVCLPREDDDFTGQDCIVTGWGKNAFVTSNFSMVMKEVTAPILSHRECQQRLRTTKLGPFFKLHGSNLCAGGTEGEDTCEGDGGGALVCYNSDNSYTVAGLVSWGIECGHEEIPGVYVNVRKFLDWISSVTNQPIEEYWSS